MGGSSEPPSTSPWESRPAHTLSALEYLPLSEGRTTHPAKHRKTTHASDLVEHQEMLLDECGFVSFFENMHLASSTQIVFS